MIIDVLIIGAGASGLMSAICAARLGKKVLVLEKKEQPGKKLLTTGNGRCNMLNLDQSEHHFHSSDSCQHIDMLKSISVQEIVSFFSEIGLLTKDRDGYLYPMSNQAQTVLKILIEEAEALGVSIACNAEVKQIEKFKGQWKVILADKSYIANSVIISTGSKAGLSIKDKTNGYELVKKLGHHIAELRPALTALVTDDKINKYWAGVRTEGAISIYDDKELIRCEKGELMLSADGISGIAAFQISSYINCIKKVTVDFLPGMNETEIMNYIMLQKKNSADKTLIKCLYGIMPIKLAESLTTELTFRSEAFKGSKAYQLTLDSIDDVRAKALVHFLKNFEIHLIGTRDFTESQVCAGGVILKEIDPKTCESILAPGIYITGELLDMNGDCGGYNLQWAWTTGILAGNAAGRRS